MLLKATWFYYFFINRLLLAAKYENEMHPVVNRTDQSSGRRASREVISSDSQEIYYIPTFSYSQTETLTSELDYEDGQIYVSQNKLSVLCVTQHSSENIIWKKYDCPDQIHTKEGDIIATGSLVSDPRLYAVHLIGRSSHTISELVLKRPLLAENDGVYICESWLPAEGYSHHPPIMTRDVFVLGGNSFINNCYRTPIYNPVYNQEIYAQPLI